MRVRARVCPLRTRGAHPDDDVAAGAVEAHLQARQLVVVLQDLVVLLLLVARQPGLGALDLLLALLRRLHEVVVHAHQRLVARDHLVDLFELREGMGGGGWGREGRTRTSAPPPKGSDPTLRPPLPALMPLPGSEALGQGAEAARPLESPCAPPELVWAVGHVLGARASRLRALSLDCRLLESPGSFNKDTCPPPPSETRINKPL